MHALKAHGAKFCSPDGSLSIVLHQMGFVDDTSNRTNDFDNQEQLTAKKMLHLMQHDAQVWHDIVWASGGDLELPKCTFHQIHFEFDHKGRPKMLQGRFSSSLHVVTAAGKKIRIKQLSVCESHKLLGCHKEPMGLQQTQLAILKTKCDESANKAVNCSTLDRHESLMFCRHICIPSVTCPLCATFFTEKQLDSIPKQTAP